MSSLKRALLLIGSPRGIKSNSTSVGNYLVDTLKKNGTVEEVETIVLTRVIRSEEKMDEMIDAIKKSGLIILASPLYDDTVSYVTLKALEYIAEHQKKPGNENLFGKKLFFPITNSGFPEPEQMEMLIALFKNFTAKTGFKWTGSLMVGSGQGLGGDIGKTLEEGGGMVKPVLEALEKVAYSIGEGIYSDESVALFPDLFFKKWFLPMLKFFVWIGNKDWKKKAKANGGDVAATPYAET